MKICPSCKKEIMDDASFCTQCGTKLEDIDVTEKEESKTIPGEKEVKNKSNGKYWIILAVVVCILAICLTVCVVILHSKDRSAENSEEMTQQIIKTTEITTELVTETNSTESQEATTEEITEQITEATTEEIEETVVDLPPDTGDVLNIYCWNEELKVQVMNSYYDYEEVDAVTGWIGDVEVKWNIVPITDNGYQVSLDKALKKQSSAAADDKVDLFLVEADYALKYVDSEYAMPISDLGITKKQLANQYQYTKDVVTDSKGVLKGVSWQSCPSALIFNRDIALEVLGTENPDEVQKCVKDWDTYIETAMLMKKHGYSMTSTVNDTYRTYSVNVTSKWVVDGKVNIDENIMAWVDDSKALVDAGATGTHDLWSEEWRRGFYPEGKVFAYFGPTWLVNYSMDAYEDGSVACNGRWGVTEGPQGSYWGGTWICAATGTDNANLVKDIILELTSDSEVMKDIFQENSTPVNNTMVMRMIATSSYSNEILGNQNPMAVFDNNATAINASYATIYDLGCNEEFMIAMRSYFEGKVTKKEAINAFKQAIVNKYPELTAE